MTRHTTTEYTRFLIVGIGNTSLGLLTIYVLLELGADDLIANASGYGVGLLFSFFVNRRWTFRSTADSVGVFARFIVVFGVAYSANLLTIMLLRLWLPDRSFLAQTAGVVIYTVLFYLGCRSVFCGSRGSEAYQR